MYGNKEYTNVLIVAISRCLDYWADYSFCKSVAFLVVIYTIISFFMIMILIFPIFLLCTFVLCNLIHLCSVNL